ncbi:hypothetical protein CDAR_72731 [Caerostris darwini]|uniref:Uncharacterized protein n=1 Tax=Caerostris darwini TaxID=1538125 RepID=A0AAV4MLT1_9ARAC|nr:hypothetical protein CDAR_72731 [Caerostris darwini]
MTVERQTKSVRYPNAEKFVLIVFMKGNIFSSSSVLNSYKLKISRAPQTPLSFLPPPLSSVPFVILPLRFQIADLGSRGILARLPTKDGGHVTRL